MLVVFGAQALSASRDLNNSENNVQRIKVYLGIRWLHGGVHRFILRSGSYNLEKRSNSNCGLMSTEPDHHPTL